jgi:hypothetical protein
MSIVVGYVGVKAIYVEVLTARQGFLPQQWRRTCSQTFVGFEQRNCWKKMGTKDEREDWIESGMNFQSRKCLIEVALGWSSCTTVFFDPCIGPP